MELGRRRSASGRWLWQTTSSTLLRILSCFHITLIFPFHGLLGLVIISGGAPGNLNSIEQTPIPTTPFSAAIW